MCDIQGFIWWINGVPMPEGGPHPFGLEGGRTAVLILYAGEKLPVGPRSMSHFWSDSDLETVIRVFEGVLGIHCL